MKVLQSLFHIEYSKYCVNTVPIESSTSENTFTKFYKSTVYFENTTYILILLILLVGLVISYIIRKHKSTNVDIKKVNTIAEKLYALSPKMVLIINTKCEVTYVNDYLLATLCISKNQVMGMGWWKIKNYTQKEIDDVKESIKTQLKNYNTKTYTKELTYNDKNFNINWTDIPFDENSILRAGEDVTDEYKQKNELKKLSLVAENVLNGVVILNAKKEIEWINKSFENLFGYTLNEIKGKRPITIFSNNISPTENQNLIINTETNTSFELLQYSKNGTPLNILIHQNVIFDKAGNIEQYINVVTDISERKKEEEKYKFIIDNAGEVIYTADYDGMFTFVSPSIKTILGFEPQELIGKHFTSIIAPEFTASVHEFYANQFYQNIVSTNLEFEVLNSKNDKIWVSQTIQIVKHSETNVSYQGVVKDINLKKRAEIAEIERFNTKEKYNKFLYEQGLVSIEKFNNLSDYFNFIIRELSMLILVDRVSLWDYKNDAIVCTYMTKERVINLEGMHIYKNDAPKYFKAIEDGLIINAPDARNYEATKELTNHYFIPNNIFSVLDIPIRLEGKLVGVICVEYYDEIKNWTNEEVDLITEVSALITLNIQTNNRMLAEKKIKESEANFRLLNETIDDVFWLMDLEQQKVVYISPSCEQVLGPSQQDFYTTFNYWKNYIFDEDKPSISAAHKDIELKGYYEVEYRIHSADGGYKWISEKSFGIKNENGVFFKSSGICTDITQSKQTKIALAESENNFRLINENLNEVFYLYNFEASKYDYISPNCLHILGVSDHFFYDGNGAQKIALFEYDKALFDGATQMVKAGKSVEIEYRIKVNNELKWIREKSVPILNAKNEVIKNSGVCSDITESKLNQDKIKQLSLVAEKTNNGVTIADENGHIIWANESYLKMFEISLETLVGKRPKDLFSNHDKELTQKLALLNKTHKSYSIELQAYTFKQNNIYIELHTTLIKTENGKTLQVEVINDITERKRTQQIIENQNQDILASIRYAQRIQNALLTPLSFFDQFEFNYFMYYKPKDIVGGDFYWASQLGPSIIIAIGDCTGHGVPGAIMTSLGINGLINAVTELKMEQPDMILTYLDEYIKKTLKNTAEFTVDDGMDIGIIRFNTESNQITYSGAGRSLIKIENGAVEKINNTRRSIGSKFITHAFTNDTFVLSKESTLYLFSDGVVDQFDPKSNKRLGSKTLNQWFLEMEHLPFQKRVHFFSNQFNNHQKDGEQTDDIILFSLKL